VNPRQTLVRTGRLLVHLLLHQAQGKLGQVEGRAVIPPHGLRPLSLVQQAGCGMLRWRTQKPPFGTVVDNMLLSRVGGMLVASWEAQSNGGADRGFHVLHRHGKGCHSPR